VTNLHLTYKSTRLWCLLSLSYFEFFLYIFWYSLIYFCCAYWRFKFRNDSNLEMIVFLLDKIVYLHIFILPILEEGFIFIEEIIVIGSIFMKFSLMHEVLNIVMLVYWCMFQVIQTLLQSTDYILFFFLLFSFKKCKYLTKLNSFFFFFKILN